MKSNIGLRDTDGYYEYILRVPPRFNDAGQVSITEEEAQVLLKDLKRKLEDG